MAINPLWNYQLTERVYVNITPDHKLSKLRVVIYRGRGDNPLSEAMLWATGLSSKESIVRELSKALEDLLWVALEEMDLQATLMGDEDGSPLELAGPET